MTDEIERVALAINGPHDTTHISKNELFLCQKVRWNMSSKQERQICLTQAKAAIAAMHPVKDRPTTPQEEAKAVLAWDLDTRELAFAAAAASGAPRLFVKWYVNALRAIAKTEPVTTSRPDWEGFGRAVLEHWPTGDVDGSELFDLSLKYNLIAEVPGGYDPEQHIDAEGISPEKGDPWYEYTFRAIAGEDRT